MQFTEAKNVVDLDPVVRAIVREELKALEDKAKAEAEAAKAAAESAKAKTKADKAGA